MKAEADDGQGANECCQT